MRIITISGSGSGVGKTTLASLLIARLTGFAAIKVTITDFFVSVTDDPGKIMEPGKDTAIMKDAGAEPVVWVQSPETDLGESLSFALNMLGDVSGVVVEGNSPVRLLKPDTAFFVMGEDPSDLKPGALEILSRADVVVVNVEADEPSTGVLAAIRRHNKAALVTTMRRMRGTDEELEDFFGRLNPPTNS